jgi:hypothetical protein
MVIEIKYTKNDYKMIMDEDSGQFYCAHDKVMLEPPCCNERDCCNGLWSAYCPDCRLTQWQADQIFEEAGV